MERVEKHLKNERGDALTPTLILSAVALTVLMGLGYSLISLMKMQKGAALSGDRTDVQEQMKSALSFRQVCLQAVNNMGAQYITPGINNTSNLKLQMFMSGQVRTLDPAAANPEAAAGLTVTSLQFVQSDVPQASSGIDVTGTGATVSGTLLTGNIVIGLKKTNTSLYARDFKPASIPAVIAVDAGNKIIGCATVANDSSTCSQMGNQWLPLNPPGEQCLRVNQCDIGGGYCQAPAGEGGFKNPATNDYKCPAGYDARQKGVVSYATSCGKSCINTTMHPVIECAKCRGLGGASIPGSTPQTYTDVTLDFSSSDTETQTSALGSFLSGLGFSF